MMIYRLLVKKEENKYGYYDTYSLIRRSVDCTLILLSLHDHPVTDRKKCYKETKNLFEEFCIFFIQKMRDEIFLKNPSKKLLRIFNDQKLLFKIIKNDFIFTKTQFTNSEKQILWLLKNGYSVKLIAKSMELTEKTIRKYLDIIKEKINVNTKLELIDVVTIIDL